MSTKIVGNKNRFKCVTKKTFRDLIEQLSTYSRSRLTRQSLFTNISSRPDISPQARLSRGTKEPRGPHISFFTNRALRSDSCALWECLYKLFAFTWLSLWPWGASSASTWNINTSLIIGSRTEGIFPFATNRRLQFLKIGLKF